MRLSRAFSTSDAGITNPSERIKISHGLHVQVLSLVTQICDFKERRDLHQPLLRPRVPRKQVDRGLMTKSSPGLAAVGALLSAENYIAGHLGIFVFSVFPTSVFGSIC